MELSNYVSSFMREVSSGSIEIYNEFSLQHELGIYLRNAVGPKWKVQFERSVSFFEISNPAFHKKEIDIVIFTPDKTNKQAIELKFPRNGQHPEQMFSAVKDVAFLEQLVEFGFCRSDFIIVVDDPLFYQGPSQGGVYAAFRAAMPLSGEITKPTGTKDQVILLHGTYNLDWKTLFSQAKWASISVGT